MKIYKYIPMLMLVLLAGCKVGLEPLSGIPPTIVAISSVGNQTISIAWADVEEASDYVISRDDTEIDSDPGFTYDDDGLTNGQKYCYEVTARAGEKRSVPSNTVCAVPIGIPVVEATPDTLSARLDWNDVPGAESYNVYQRDGDSEDLVEEGTTENSFRVDGLSNNCVVYDFKIVPVDGDGRETSEEIEWVSVEPLNAGIVDETFAANGILQDSSTGSFTDVAVLRDGTILALVSADPSKLVGYDQDGNLLWETIFSGSDHDLLNAKAFVVDSQERVIVVGSNRLCRLLPTDSGYVFDDAGFGFDVVGNHLNGCSSDAPIDEGLQGMDVTIDSEGRIIIAGYVNPADEILIVRRFLSDGMLDLAFGTAYGAFYYDPVSKGYSLITAFDGGEEKIYVAGLESEAAEVDALMLTLSDAGVLLNELSFESSNCGGKDIIQLANGNIAVLSADCSLTEVRLFSPASDLLDTYTYSYPGGINVPQVAEQNCREGLLVGGNVYTSKWASVFRIRSNFALDDSFGVGGWFIHGGEGNMNAIAFDSLGRLMVAGSLGTSPEINPVLWRLK